MPVDETLAEKLEAFFGTRAGFWLPQEASYRQRQAEDALKATQEAT